MRVRSTQYHLGTLSEHLLLEGWSGTHAHARTHTHTHTHTHTNTHTHTHSDATLGNIGQTLSVAAAELTLESLGVFIRQALPLCGTSGPVSCFLLDDVGNIIYDSAVVSNPRFLGGVHFLGQQFLNNFFQERRTLITNLLGMNNVLTKMECADYFNLDVKTRRFYGVS